jgi:hypothetical protein
MRSRAQVRSFHRAGDIATTVVDCIEPPPEPIAPGCLFEDGTPTTVIELHKLVEREGSSLRFETYGEVEQQPLVGREYILQSWWLPGTLELVMALDRVWTREQYPPDRDDCEYCPLTWRWFGRGESKDSVMEGYHSGDVWITVAAYERFIRDDALRIRATLKTDN